MSRPTPRSLPTVDVTPRLPSEGLWATVQQALVSRPLWLLLGLAVLSRVLVYLVATESYRTEAPPPGPSWVWPFVRWDSAYYLRIADEGYASEELWAFHPGFPFLMRVLSLVLPIEPVTAGFLVANLGFFAAVALFFAFTREVFDQGAALGASLAFALFPGAFFCTAIYPESLFLTFLVLCLWSLRRRRWLWAGAFISASTAMRPQGLFLVPALVGLVAHARWRHGRFPGGAWGSLVLATAFPAAFSLYAWTQTGDPLVWVHAREEHWRGVGWHPPWEAFRRVHATFVGSMGLPVIGLAAIVATTAFIAWDVWATRRRAAYPAYAFSLVAVAGVLLYADVGSMLRYSLALPPLFWWVGSKLRRWWLLVPLLAAFAAGLAYVAWMFASGRHAV